MKKVIRLNVNGEDYEVLVEPYWTLLKVLREVLKFKGPKEGCGIGECGACTVYIDGLPVKSCLVLGVEVEGAKIVTIEGLGEKGEISGIQKAFLEEGAVQCGFCTPGMVMALNALYDRNSNPSDDDIKEALKGHLCRCTGYESITKAAKKAKDYYDKKI